MAGFLITAGFEIEEIIEREPYPASSIRTAGLHFHPASKGSLLKMPSPGGYHASQKVFVSPMASSLHQR
jgi:hypothetical protein